MKPVPLAVALALALAPPAAAQREAPSGAVREGTLSFDARATAGDFTRHDAHGDRRDDRGRAVRGPRLGRGAGRRRS